VEYVILRYFKSLVNKNSRKVVFVDRLKKRKKEMTKSSLSYIIKERRIYEN